MYVLLIAVCMSRNEVELTKRERMVYFQERCDPGLSSTSVLRAHRPTGGNDVVCLLVHTAITRNYLFAVIFSCALFSESLKLPKMMLKCSDEQAGRPIEKEACSFLFMQKARSPRCFSSL